MRNAQQAGVPRGIWEVGNAILALQAHSVQSLDSFVTSVPKIPLASNETARLVKAVSAISELRMKVRHSARYVLLGIRSRERYKVVSV